MHNGASRANRLRTPAYVHTAVFYGCNAGQPLCCNVGMLLTCYAGGPRFCSAGAAHLYNAVTGSVAKRAVGSTDSRATRATGSWATSATVSRATGAAGFTAPTPYNFPHSPKPPCHTPQHPYCHSLNSPTPSLPSPHSGMCSSGRERRRGGSSLLTPATPIPSPPLLHPQQGDGGEGGRRGG
ncbi:unnamed protein product, partial [Closterium sp. NIES-53]